MCPLGSRGNCRAEDRILRGADQPREDVRQVRAGDLSAEFAAGGLRYLRMGDIEVARRIVVAVRDQAWNTVPGILSDVRIHQTRDEFRITFSSRHEADELCFIWTGHHWRYGGRVVLLQHGRQRRHVVPVPPDRHLRTAPA